MFDIYNHIYSTIYLCPTLFNLGPFYILRSNMSVDKNIFLMKWLAKPEINKKSCCCQVMQVKWVTSFIGSKEVIWIFLHLKSKVTHMKCQSSRSPYDNYPGILFAEASEQKCFFVFLAIKWLNVHPDWNLSEVHMLSIVKLIDVQLYCSANFWHSEICTWDLRKTERNIICKQQILLLCIIWK